MTATVPYSVDRAIRGAMPFSAIVDINGVMNPKTGGFHVVQDAIDAGHKSIFIRAGTYPSFDADVAQLFIMGESWDVIIDGESADDAIDVTAARVRITNLTVQTTGGGGGSINTITATSAGTDLVVDHVRIADSDGNGIVCSGVDSEFSFCLFVKSDDMSIYIVAARNRVHNNHIESSSGQSIRVTGDGDNFIITNNLIESTGTCILIDSGGDNGLVVGNVTNGVVTDSGAGNTVASNEQY